MDGLTRDSRPGYQSLVASSRDLCSLRDGDMISDDIIYAALALLIAAVDKHTTKFALVHSQAYGKWLEQPEPIDKVFKMAQSSAFWHHRHLLLPVFHDMHWMAASISLDEATIDFYDSFANESKAELHGGVRITRDSTLLANPPCIARCAILNRHLCLRAR